MVATTLVVGVLAVAQSPASAATTTYTATETIPVPPASTYAGSGGGDGWAVALSSTAVYNVFHHAGYLEVACHLQADASACWSPEIITDGSGNGFASSGQPGLWLDQNSGRLYVYATRTSDQTGGVVCIDTTQAASNPDPFCGFTALTATGEAPISSGISALSDPAVVGSRWYAFNYVSGSTATGTKNSLLCFDLTTFAACGSQPYFLNFGAGTVSAGSFPEPAVATIGHDVIVPVNVNGADQLACFDNNTLANCTGSWPIALGISYASNYGAPYPLLSNTGALLGVCLPTGTDPCYDLTGASVATPAGMPGAISATLGWNGPAFTLGPRVYVPSGWGGVLCYDAATDASCVNFPKSFSNLDLLYTVNADPQRPECIWVNSDNGSGQIQNFDAYTGGACGQGPIRVLASSFVVPNPVCAPTSYTKLQVLQPARNSYSDGTVAFEDGDGNPLPQSDLTLDNTGSISLVGLNLSTNIGLPEFLITLNGAQGTPSSVQVQLTWTGTDDPSCVPHGGGSSGCTDAVFIAASGSDQHYTTDTDLTISPEIKKAYDAMVTQLAGRRSVHVKVLNYPALSVNVIGQNLSGNPYQRLQKVLNVNLPTYLAGKDEGVAALWGAFTAARFGCPDEKIILAGYSQGAMVVHEFLAQLASANDPSGKAAIRGVILIADPERVKHTNVVEFGDAAYSSFGICDYASINSKTSCTDPFPLVDIPSTFVRVSTDLCFQYDVVCDTSELFHDFGWNTPSGWQAALKLGMTTHTGTYQFDPRTATAGKRAANTLLSG